MEQLLNVIENKGKQIIMILLATVLILVVILFGKLFATNQKESADDFYEELLLEEESETNEEQAELDVSSPEELNTEIMVDVKGAVLRPGVYKMDATNRIIDAVQIAGGLQANAEEKGVNFAQKLEDQMVIYIPEIGEEVDDIPYITSTSDLNQEETEGHLIDINTADKEGLMSLNGIGPAKADSIIQYREEEGYFKTIEDLKNVSGIGEATFNKLKDYIKISSE